MINLRHVSKTFRKLHEEVHAVRDISLTIAQKEIVAIIGPSGCGKSTLLNMIAGLYPPTSGSIVYKGERVADVNTDVGYMTQKFGLYEDLTVQENLDLYADLRGVVGPDLAREGEPLEAVHRRIRVVRLVLVVERLHVGVLDLDRREDHALERRAEGELGARHLRPRIDIAVPGLRVRLGLRISFE